MYAANPKSSPGTTPTNLTLLRTHANCRPVNTAITNKAKNTMEIDTNVNMPFLIILKPSTSSIKNRWYKNALLRPNPTIEPIVISIVLRMPRRTDAKIIKYLKKEFWIKKMENEYKNITINGKNG
mgnify:CR=1 FL=1